MPHFTSSSLIKAEEVARKACSTSGKRLTRTRNDIYLKPMQRKGGNKAGKPDFLRPQRPGFKSGANLNLLPGFFSSSILRASHLRQRGSMERVHAKLSVQGLAHSRCLIKEAITVKSQNGLD